MSDSNLLFSCPKVDSNSNEELDKLKALIKGQGEQIAGLGTRMEELKSELKLEIKDVGINRVEASFKFELDIKSFLNLVGPNQAIQSKRFWCKGLQWSIMVKCRLQNSSKYLGAFLYCHMNPNWFCKARFSLALFNQLSDAKCLGGSATYDFSEDETGFGFPCLISCDKLVDEKNGYIKDNKIVLCLDLKELIRVAALEG